MDLYSGGHCPHIRVRVLGSEWRVFSNGHTATQVFQSWIASYCVPEVLSGHATVDERHCDAILQAMIPVRGSG
jgi:hypothetical protein